MLTESDYRNYDDGFSYPIPDDLSFPFESECTVRAYDSLALRRRADVTEATAAGIKCTSKKILQYAVILLGFGLNLGEIAKVGASSLPIIVSTITPSLVISFVLCRVMHIPCRISTLVGVGSSICGGSAIAATAPVIDADDEEIAQAISVIFLFNIIAALIFLSIGAILGMSNEGFGLFAGKRHYHRVRAARGGDRADQDAVEVLHCDGDGRDRLQHRRRQAGEDGRQVDLHGSVLLDWHYLREPRHAECSRYLVTHHPQTR